MEVDAENLKMQEKVKQVKAQNLAVTNRLTERYGVEESLKGKISELDVKLQESTDFILKNRLDIKNAKANNLYLMS